jgi:hypothetical protein
VIVYQYSWPPPPPSFVAQFVTAGGFPVSGGVYGPDWHTKIDERNRQLVAKAERGAAESEARQREREKREKAELEALRESERQRVLAAMRPGGCRWTKSANGSDPWTFPLTRCSHFVLMALR